VEKRLLELEEAIFATKVSAIEQNLDEYLGRLREAF